MYRGGRLKHLKASYRSGLEVKTGDRIKAILGFEADYENIVIPYTIPAKGHRYTPDFFLPNGIIVETKGIWDPHDRQKVLLVREQNPRLDLRMVFSNAKAKLYKGSKTTYAMFCDKHGIKWAHRDIPVAWVEEAMEPDRYTAAMEFTK